MHMTIVPGKTYIGKVRLRRAYIWIDEIQQLEGKEVIAVCHSVFGKEPLLDIEPDFWLYSGDFEWLREKVE